MTFPVTPVPYNGYGKTMLELTINAVISKYLKTLMQLVTVNAKIKDIALKASVCVKNTSLGLSVRSTVQQTE